VAKRTGGGGGQPALRAYFYTNLVGTLTGGVRRTYTFGPGIDNGLAMTAIGASETDIYYYLTDHLGSVVAITDDNGAIVERYDYDAWGRTSVSDAVGVPSEESALNNRIAFQGREYSWSTGLYYFRARWYDPITGRWLSKDPIGISGGLNHHVAFANNPVNFLDYRGLNAYYVNNGTKHSYIVVDNPSGRVSAFHKYSQDHYNTYSDSSSSAKSSAHTTAIIYDDVEIWREDAPSLEDLIRGDLAKGYPVNIARVAIGTSLDDELMIKYLNDVAQADEGFFSVLLGSHCHSETFDWFIQYRGWSGVRSPWPTSLLFDPFWSQVGSPPHIDWTPRAVMPRLTR
jgi:RHS repeat-associated protein